MYEEYGLWLLLGLIVKITDSQVDEKIFRPLPKISFVLAIAYGVVAGILLSFNPLFATVALAILVAVLLAGKIDDSSHQLGIATAIAVAATGGLKEISVGPFLFIVAASYFDEKLSDAADAGRIRHRLADWFFSHRLGTDAAAIILSIVTGNAGYAAAILLFDFGYQLSSMISERYAPKVMRGHHLILDLFDCDEKVLSNEKAVRKFLFGMPAKIGMHRIAGPFVVRFEPADKAKKREWGISGITIIAESHISCHTYPYKATCKVDIYSCKEFDEKKAEKIVAQYFGSKNYSTKMLVRAVDEHLALADKEGAKKILEKERK